MKAIPPIESYSPGVLSLIPLYYIGWSDNLLSPSEIQLIREKIARLKFLSPEDKILLDQWSDPQNPPSPPLFKQWAKLLKFAAAKLPNDRLQSLAELGIEMAKRSAIDDTLAIWRSAQTKTALQELEEAFSVDPGIFHRLFAGHIQVEDNYQSSFEPKEVQLLLDDDYHELRERMRTLLSDPVFQYQTTHNKEIYRAKVLEWCHLLAKQGLGSFSYPIAQGGRGDMGSYAVIFEMLGYHDLSLTIKFGVQFGLFGGSIQWLGTEWHHQQYLEAVGKLELPGCFAMTETGHGSNVRGLETTAKYDPHSQEIIIHSPNESSGKEYIGNALHGRMASVFAQLIVNGKNQGVHAILVPLRDMEGQLLPGIRIEDCGYKLGLNGVDNGRIWFDQVRVPKANLLNRFGDIDEEGNYQSPIKESGRRFFTMLGTLVGGRVCVPRAGLSATKSALTIAIRYGLKRRQFALKPGEKETLLLDYPSHQRRLMPLLAKTYALDFALTHLTKRYVKRNDEDIREIETLAAGLKSYSTWFTTEAIQECREACGGKGYLSENRFADLKADTDIFTTFEGDNTVLMQLVAKGLLSDFKKEFHDEGYRAVMRFLLEQVSDTLSQWNPLSSRNTELAHLRDSDFHLEAFRYRERKLLISVSQRIRRYLKNQIPASEAFLRCQTHLLSLAEAYVERLIVEQFVAVVNQQRKPEIRQTLKRLCDLFALSTLEKHKGWYLEQDYMEGVKTKAIRKTVDHLCGEVRKDAWGLIQAFAIPEACLAAPIATYK